MFNCTAIASLITWEIDGVLIDNNIRDKGFDDSAPLSTLNSTQDLRGTSLRVLGSPDSNNVSITCLAIIPITPFTSDANTSEPALMLVQGKSIGMHVQLESWHVAIVHNYKNANNTNKTSCLVPWHQSWTILTLEHQCSKPKT